jgi:fibronectin type 3 domain-containing protein
MYAIHNSKLTGSITGPVLLVMLILCACGHDSKRDNPLDPALTLPVQLRVAVDDSAGVATLTWTPFEGEAAFAEYRVVRNEAERTIVDTLAILSSVTQTSFVDSSLVPETSYSYRVLSVNTSGFEAISDPHAIRLRTPSAVRIEVIDLDSRTASAAVRWSQYTGRDFASYQLLRSAGFETQMVAQTQDRLDTTFVDAGLKGNIEYSYQVVVLTTAMRTSPVPP